MEYYIMKRYEDEKNKSDSIKEGFKRFPRKIRVLILSLLASIAIIILTIIVLSFLQKNTLVLIGMIIEIALLIALGITDAKNEKISIQNRIKCHSEKLNLLIKILEEDEFKVNSKGKIELLITKYEEYIKSEKEGEKARNKIIVALFSGLATITTISITNLDLIGISFVEWLYLILLVLIIISGVSLWVYCGRFFQTNLFKYKQIILDLKDVIIWKY